MTILGQHTVAETRGMIRVVQYRVDEVSKAFARIPDAWKTAHPAEYAAIARDWANVVHDWNEALGIVELDLKVRSAASGGREDLAPADISYRKILGFVEYGENTGTVRTPGDLRDTQERIEKANGAPVNLQGRPDISKEPDPDLRVYKSADEVLRSGEAAAKSHFTWAAIGAGIVIALYGLKRVYLPRV